MPAEAQWTETVRARIEPPLLEAIQQLQAGNGIKSQSKMVRALIRRGIQAVVADSEEGQAKSNVRQMDHGTRMEHAAAHMQALSDLIANTETYDPEGAAALAHHVAQSTAVYADDLATRHGFEPPSRNAELRARARRIAKKTPGQSS